MRWFQTLFCFLMRFTYCPDMSESDSPQRKLITALEAARYICRKSGWTLTNLALQKILYLAQMVHLGRTGTPAFQGTFQAWDYGPVEPTVYRTVSMYGNEPISDVFIFAGAKDISDEGVRAFLDESCDFLFQKSAGQLVNMTHWTDGAWAKHYAPGAKNVEIPEKDILEEYQRRADGGDRPTKN